MLNVEESSLVESKPIPSLDSTHEPSPEPQTPKERLIHPSDSSFEVPYRIRGLWQYLKTLWAQKSLHVLLRKFPLK